MSNRTHKLTIRFRLSSFLVLLAAVFILTKVSRTFSGVVGESGGIWNYIQIIYVLIGIVWSIKYLSLINKNSPLVLLLVLGILMLFLSVPYISISVSGIYNYMMIPYAALVLVVFYRVGIEKEITDRNILYVAFYAIAFVVIGTMIRFLSSGSRLYTEIIDVADVYYVLGLLPLIIIYAKKKLQFVPILLTALALVLSGKRTGILAIVGMILALYLVNAEKSDLKNSTKKIIGLLLIGSVLYIGAQYLDSFFNIRLFVRLERMARDGGSGRIWRWTTVLDAIKSSSLLQLAIGHGWGSVANILGGHAHNDFLEIFYEFGLFALALYVLFFFSLIIKAWQMIKNRYRYAPEFVACIICSLFLSVFSFYLIKPTYITCGMICYGLLLSDFEKQKQQKIEG